jgi:3,4-dihydroxy 2-butanone 4-phosphate synthase/GTP cyclohydrolase II
MSDHDPELFHPDPLVRVQRAMEEMRAGRMVIMVDDEDRENEGDIVLAAQHITPEHINFMATHARGLICLSMTASQVERLGLPMMASNNQSAYNTAFTVSIEAREGVTTGISAADRAHTIRVAARPDAHRRDVITPGHIFPLRARDGGVLERVGQTEGSVDLVRLAGLDPAAVICEIMNDDGTMARLPDLLVYARRFNIPIVAVADLIKHRMQSERIVRREQQGSLELPGLGRWTVSLYRGLTAEGLHLALTYGDVDERPTLVRVQGSPASWSFLQPERSVLSGPARAAMQQIHAEGKGALVLMYAGGRTMDQIYTAFERDFGGSGEAPIQPRAEALRDLGAGCQILRDLGLRRVRLLTSGARPMAGIEAYGLIVEELRPI